MLILSKMSKVNFALCYLAIFCSTEVSGFTKTVVVTTKGICLNGCTDIGNLNMYATSKDMEIGPYETAIDESKDGSVKKYYFFHRSDRFHYCNTTKDKHVRCSPNEVDSSAVFEKRDYGDRFGGYIVKDKLQCLTECVPKYDGGSSPSLGCHVEWDMFDSTAHCSYHGDHLAYSSEFYQLTTAGLILIPANRQCIVLSFKYETGWDFAACGSRLGLYSISGRRCTSECQIKDGSLACITEGGAQSDCNINLPNAGPNAIYCRNWLQRKQVEQGPQVVNFESNYCSGEDILIVEETIRISEAKAATNNFRCNSTETSRYITIIAVSIYVDENIEIYGGVDRRFLQLSLVSKTIHITEEVTFKLKGSNANEGIGKWAEGGIGGDFLVIALEWENPSFLSVDTSGGIGGCEISSHFEFGTRDIPLQAKVYKAVTFEHSAFTYKFLNDDSAKCGHTCYEFEVYGALKYGNAAGGEAGKSYVFGIEEIPTIENHGEGDRCRSSLQPSQNCLQTLYGGNGLWYSSPFVFDFPVPIYTESYFYPIRKWISLLSEEDWTEKEIVDLSSLVDSAQTMLGLDSATMFYEELKYLITNSQNISNPLELKLLESLKKRIGKFDSNDTTNSSLLIWDFTATAAHYRRVQGQDSLITNLKFYIDKKAGEINRLSDNKVRNKLISESANSYKKESEDKITEANKLIKEEVLPQISEIREKLVAQLKSVEQEIKDDIQQATEKVKELKENLDKAIKNKHANLAFNSIKAIGGVVSCMPPPIGQVAGAIIVGGSKVAKTAAGNALARKNTKDFPKKLPTEIWSNMKPSADWIEQKHTKLIQKLQKILTDYENYEDIKEFLLFVEIKLQELRISNPMTNKMVTKRDQYKTTKDIDRDVRKELQKIVDSETNLQIRNFQGAKFKRQLVANDSKQLATGITTTLDGVSDGISDYFKDEAEIAKYAKEIRETEGAIRTLKKFENDFHANLMPMVLGVLDTFDLITQEMNVTSMASIDVTSWSMESNINDMTEMLENVLKTFKAGEEIQSSMKKITKAIRMVATLFGRIVAAKDEQRLANLLANVAVAGSYDGNVAAFVKNLNDAMQQAIIHAEVEKAMYAFRQWSFPFANVYLAEFEELPFSFGNVDTRDEIQKASETLTKIKDVLDADGYELNEAQRYISTAEFRRSKIGLDPFYTWEFKAHNASILKLLAANGPVYFYADVDQYMADDKNFKKEAIKFKTIKFAFHVQNNKKKQKQIDKELERCKIIAEHMGYSYYKFQNKNYLFTSRSYNFETSVGKTHSGSASYANGTSVLSPYGMWQLQIKNNVPKTKLYGLLTSETDVVDLDLVGTGQYVDTDSELDIEEAELDKHYRRYEVLNQTVTELEFPPPEEN